MALQDKIPLKVALRWILTSIFIVSILFFLIFSYYYGVRQKRISDDTFKIVAIIQDSGDRESLPTSYLAELLDLSSDKSENLYHFDLNKGVSELRKSPLIKSASITKLKPGSLFITYKMRKPIALLGDYENVAVDNEGYLFPFIPFFTPKRLPILYLGIGDWNQPESDFREAGGQWNKPLKGDKINLAFEILNYFANLQEIQLKKLDLSESFSPSYGKREIIIYLEEKKEMKQGINILFISPKILRLATQNYQEGLQEYQQLTNQLMIDTLSKIKTNDPIVRLPLSIIDLRVPKMAFVSK